MVKIRKMWGKVGKICRRNVRKNGVRFGETMGKYRKHLWKIMGKWE